MDDTKVTKEQAISWFEKRLEQRPTPGERVVFSMALSSMRTQQEKKPDGWISVKKELPKESGKYLCHAIIPVVYGGFRSMVLVTDFCSHSKFWACEDMIVTHWQDLPELPEVF